MDSCMCRNVRMPCERIQHKILFWMAGPSRNRQWKNVHVRGGGERGDNIGKRGGGVIMYGREGEGNKLSLSRWHAQVNY